MTSPCYGCRVAVARLCLAALVGAAALAVATPAHALVVRADNWIDTFAVKDDGTLGGAKAALGEPSRLFYTSDLSCRARWASVGIWMDFYNLGGDDPCADATGHFSRAIIRGPVWETGKGLGIGDRLRKLRRLYPNAVRRSDGAGRVGWWLVVRRSPYGLGGRYPGLLGLSRDRRVTGFVVRYPAGGD
jgi:hypothetical protein